MNGASRLYMMIGPAGVVLIVLAVVAMFLALKNFIFLALVGRDFRQAARSLAATPENRDGILMRFAKNPIIAIIDGVIKTHGRHSDDLKAEVAYLFHRYFARAQRDITFLRVIAVISPLLGLLGTLLGLLGVFQALSHTTAVSTSTVLAAGIWEAIITTIMGLTLAIPTLIAYYILSLKLRSFHLVSIEYGYRFLECRPRPCRDHQSSQAARSEDMSADKAMVAA
ncbi:MotA/TolQ/ExbB proton channel family protein [Deltaproteobacteria bacterium Smac51]|nr:MotA/TolQ/ExbB proton channel family protein [Deltaproteobacteria bacterium Smac51]